VLFFVGAVIGGLAIKNRAGAAEPAPDEVAAPVAIPR
jgi:hypothetical protein